MSLCVHSVELKRFYSISELLPNPTKHMMAVRPSDVIALTPDQPSRDCTTPLLVFNAHTRLKNHGLIQNIPSSISIGRVHTSPHTTHTHTATSYLLYLQPPPSLSLSYLSPCFIGLSPGLCYMTEAGYGGLSPSLHGNTSSPLPPQQPGHGPCWDSNAVTGT